MRLLINILILIASVEVGCTDHRNDIPQDIIPKEKMIMVMADIHLLEARIQMDNLGYNDSSRAIAYSGYQYIFKKNNIDAKVFKRSFDFYVDHPVLMADMYKDILTELSRRQMKSLRK